MTRHRSPSADKLLDYKKQRRYSYGNNQKAARVAVPRNESQRQRTYRRSVRQITSGAAGLCSEEFLHVASELTTAIRRREWKKQPGQTLGEQLACRLFG